MLKTSTLIAQAYFVAVVQLCFRSVYIPIACLAPARLAWLIIIVCTMALIQGADTHNMYTFLGNAYTGPQMALFISLRRAAFSERSC